MSIVEPRGKIGRHTRVGKELLIICIASWFILVWCSFVIISSYVTKTFQLHFSCSLIIGRLEMYWYSDSLDVVILLHYLYLRRFVVTKEHIIEGSLPLWTIVNICSKIIRIECLLVCAANFQWILQCYRCEKVGVKLVLWRVYTQQSCPLCLLQTVIKHGAYEEGPLFCTEIIMAVGKTFIYTQNTFYCCPFICSRTFVMIETVATLKMWFLLALQFIIKSTSDIFRSC